MRLVLRLLLISLLAVAVLAIGLVYLAVENSPLVSAQAAPTPAHAQRARWLLARNDPRYLRPGVLRSVVVSQEDLDVAANYLANRYLGSASQILLQDRRATIRVSLALPPNPVGRFINLDAALRESQTLPRFEQLRVGRVRVPAWLCNWLLDFGLHRLQASAQYSATADVIKQVRSRNGFLTVLYQWSDAVPQQIKAALVGPQEQARWRIYQERLVELTGQSGLQRMLPLEQLLGPLLQLAAQRSVSGDGAAENRAALVVLAFYVNGKGLGALVAAARDWPTAQRHVVTLAGRTDLSQHFTISALLAATAGSPLSDSVGLYKELEDARVGSGFSFNDLAADRAGTRLGELAIATPPAIGRLHRLAAAGLQQSDLMPEVRDLPEFLSETEFLRRFGGVGQPRYQQLVDQIEQRIAALPLYRPDGNALPRRAGSAAGS